MQGRVVQAQVAGLQSNSASYDARGRLASVTQGTGVDARTVTFSYGDAGFVDVITDALGRTRGFGYDAAGRVIRQTLSDGEQVFTAFDATGNLSTVTPPGRPAHAFGYTVVDLTQRYLPPDAGSATDYGYDFDRQLTRVTRADGQQLSLSYADAGRPDSLTLPTGTARYSYDSTGKLAGLSAAGGEALAFTYDGGLLTKTVWSGPVAGSVEAGYDAELRLASLGVNAGAPVALQYDADGVLNHAGALTLNRSAQNGLPTSTVLGGVADAFVYDGLGQVTLYTASRGATELFKTAYAYDKLGRITTKTETVGGITDVFDYGYELSGHLAQVKKNGAVTASYSYDGNGNRLSAPNLVGAASYDSQDRLLQYGVSAYTYSPDGELKSQTTGAAATAYDYDALGNLAHVTLPSGDSIDYVVDAFNRHTGKKLNGALVQGFLYQDRLRPIAELDGNNQFVSRFVYATRVNVPEYLVKAGATYRLVTDHLGSVRLVVDVATGVVAQRLDYDEFGQVLADSSPGFQPFGFAGGLYDAATGLVRFGARDYLPLLARWTTKDPILFDSGDTNFYGYAQNDPINFVDPDGTSTFKIAYRVLGAGIRVAKAISRGAALKRIAAGKDVLVKGAKAAKTLAKDASTIKGAGGTACKDPPHGAGVKHYHATDALGDHVPGTGHIFFEGLKSIPAIIFDSNGDGNYLDNEDIFNLVNPIGDYEDFHGSRYNPNTDTIPGEGPI